MIFSKNRYPLFRIMLYAAAISGSDVSKLARAKLSVRSNACRSLPADSCSSAGLIASAPDSSSRASLDSSTKPKVADELLIECASRSMVERARRSDAMVAHFTGCIRKEDLQHLRGVLLPKFGDQFSERCLLEQRHFIHGLILPSARRSKASPPGGLDAGHSEGEWRRRKTRPPKLSRCFTTD